MCSEPSSWTPSSTLPIGPVAAGLEGTARAQAWMLRLEISALAAGRRAGIAWDQLAKGLPCGSRGDLSLAVRGMAMPARRPLPLLEGVGGDAASPLGLQGCVLLSTLHGSVSSCFLKSRGRFQPPCRAATGASLQPILCLFSP